MLRGSRRGKDLSKLFSAPLNKMVHLADAAHPTGHTSLPQVDARSSEETSPVWEVFVLCFSLCQVQARGGDFSTWEGWSLASPIRLYRASVTLPCGPRCMPNSHQASEGIHQALSTPTPMVWTIHSPPPTILHCA